VSIFDGIEHKAGATGRDADITPGQYVFEVLSMADGKTKFTQEDFFEVRVKVVDSKGTVTKAKDGTDLQPLPVDSETKVFITKDKWGYFITDIKNVVAAIATSLDQAEVKPSDVTEALIKEFVGPDQLGKGARFQAHYDAKPGKFRKSGVPACGMKFGGILEANGKAA
jgi:hypothetical protein